MTNILVLLYNLICLQINPLIQNLVQALSVSFFNRSFEITRFDRLAEEPACIHLQSSPKRLLAHFIAKQMHDVSAFVVNKRAIFSSRVKPIRKNQGLVFARCAHLFVVRSIGFYLSHISITTKTMFDVGGGHERRNALVQPEMVPIAAGHHVAPPLMRQFVWTKP